MHFNTNCISFRGSSHVQLGLPCQDSSGFYADETYSVIVVADGHGSSPHIRSEVGSRIATERALDEIRAFMDKHINNKTIDKSEVNALQARILEKWISDVDIHYQNNGLTEKEIKRIGNVDVTSNLTYYGTTLVVGVVTADYSFGIQIGDGRLIALKRDNTIDLNYIEPDPQCDGVFSTSMSSHDASHIFRNTIVEGGEVIGLAACTDGFTESFVKEDLESYVMGFMSLMANNDYWYKSIANQIEACTHRGKKDDCSVSIAVSSNIDYEELFETVFKKKSKNLNAEESKVISRKIVIDGIRKNKQFLESWEWDTTFGHRYWCMSVVNGNPSMIQDLETRYRGNIVGYEKNGYGKEERLDGSLTYEGNFKNGSWEGFGTLWVKDSKELLEYNSQNNYRQSDGTKEEGRLYLQYKGDFKNGLYHGAGKLYDRGNLRYDGHFKNGKMEGTGVEYGDITATDVFYSNGEKQKHADISSETINQLMPESELNESELNILAIIRKSDTTYRQLSEESHLTDYCIKKTINHLVALGLIKKKKIGTRYKISAIMNEEPTEKL